MVRLVRHAGAILLTILMCRAAHLDAQQPYPSTSDYRQAGPYPATAPQAASRPPTTAPRGPYPAAGGQVRAAPSGRNGQTQPAPRAEPSAQLLEGGTVAARVGNEIVMASEILVGVELIMRENQGRAPQHELEKAKRMLMERNLKQVIETKLVFADARRKIPAEGFPQILDKLASEFEKRQLPRLYEMTEATTQTELSARLKEMGTSIDQQKQIFTERTLAQQWLRQQVNYDVEVSHEEMVDYYREHEGDYRFEATARWEELMARFDQFSSRAEAYRAIAEMGNEVWRGRAFADVAKQRSQGVSAPRGGSYDWTTRGSLVYENLNRALFTLPTGQLSQVIETEKGFHIIRVVERRAAGKKPFVEAQVEIKEEIKKNRVKAQIDEYVDTLRAETKVWTIFDNAPPVEQATAPGQPGGDRYGPR